jgi:hypothetical protein
MQILVDINIQGDAELLLAFLVKEGWAELLDLEFVYFAEASLPDDSDDTVIWRYAQTEGMLLLTNNRNEEDETSLTATIRRENTDSSLPVLTVANPSRLKESAYRRAVAERIAEILFYLEDYLGTGRLFIP